MRGYRFVMADERRRLNDAATGALDAFRTDLRVESSDLSAPDLPIEPSEVSVGDLPAVSPETPASDPPVEPSDKFYRDTLKKSLEASMSDQIVAADQPVEHLDTSICSLPINQSKTCLMDLPREILLIIFSSLSFLDLAAMASAFPKAREIIDFYDLIRVRELQCFCLKEHFQDSKLGVDVDIGYHGKEKKLSSEFDLLSHRAFYQHNIRKSIHGLQFEHWLPLPISRRHFGTVKAGNSPVLGYTGFRRQLRRCLPLQRPLALPERYRRLIQ